MFYFVCVKWSQTRGFLFNFWLLVIQYYWSITHTHAHIYNFCSGLINHLLRVDGSGGDDADKVAINDIFEVVPVLYRSKRCLYSWRSISNTLLCFVHRLPLIRVEVLKNNFESLSPNVVVIDWLLALCFLSLPLSLLFLLDFRYFLKIIKDITHAW